MQRIAKNMVTHQLGNMERALREAGDESPISFIPGNKAYGQTNKLLLGKVNIWADGMAGHTTREAYNALRVMVAALAVANEAKEN